MEKLINSLSCSIAMYTLHIQIFKTLKYINTVNDRDMKNVYLPR